MIARIARFLVRVIDSIIDSLTGRTFLEEVQIPLKPPPNRWSGFSDGELKDLLASQELGRAVRIYRGEYEDKFQIHRDIEAELRRRDAYPIGMAR